MIRPRKCPCCTRALATVATFEDSVLRCDWDGFFHWDPRYRRLRHVNSRQAWNVDGVGQILTATSTGTQQFNPRLMRKPPRMVELPKLP